MSFGTQKKKQQDDRPGLWLVETFSTSPLKPLIEFNETWQEARYHCSLQSSCFSGRLKTKTGWPPWPLIGWDISTSHLKPLNGIQRNLTGSTISMFSIKFVFFGPIGKIRWQQSPLIGWDIFDFSPGTAEGNSTKLDRKQDLNVLYQVRVFRTDWQKHHDGRPGIWLAGILRLLLWNRKTECSETWQEA